MFTMYHLCSMTYDGICLCHKYLCLCHCTPPVVEVLCALGHQGPLNPSSLLFIYLATGAYALSLPALCSCHTATAVNSLVLLPIGYLQVINCCNSREGHFCLR
eukprot:GHUV01057860.1.p2 GENE.GHUV01057860.1~~GHUV01057860.1.p2  ORF type:complete len:103 (+),score=5.30 GHUV01057860.1:185-493(+)